MREERVFLLRNFANIYFRPPDLLVPNLLSPFGEALVSSAKDLLRHDNVTGPLYETRGVINNNYSRLHDCVVSNVTGNQKTLSQNEGHW